MTRKKNQKKSVNSSISDKSYQNTFIKPQVSVQRKILRVKAYTPICKPLNGSLPGRSNSHLLKLWTFPYQYKNGKELKESTATAYLIKGLRGAIRHQVMFDCRHRGLEVCHSSDKKTDKSGNSLLPDGFHLLGSCTDREECIVHMIFGSKNHRSKIRVSAAPIANIGHKTYQTSFKIQNVQIATENRVSLTYDGKSIQNFGERYFAGEFEFEIDVTECTPIELGLLIESVMYLQKLGRGYNAGYAELKVISLKLVDQRTIRTPKRTKTDEFIIEEQLKENPLSEEVTTALSEWTDYLEKIT